MRGLNYHHLHYFWAVARHRGVRQASRILHVTEPTISEQVRQLEAALEVPLFRREGRSLVLTERGEMVFRYADSIFAIGDELLAALADRPPGHTRVFVIGVADVLPKMASLQLLEAVLSEPTVRLVVREDRPEVLLGRLETHTVDAVLTDAPAGPTVAPRAVSQLLGESPIGFFASRSLCEQLREGFPKSLNGAPLLLPQSHNPNRRQVDRWLRQNNLRPDTVAEFDDGAMMKAFGQGGYGVFPAPLVVAKEICKQYNVEVLGELDGVFESFYLVTLEHQDAVDPAVRAIQSAARERLFSNV